MNTEAKVTTGVSLYTLAGWLSILQAVIVILPKVVGYLSEGKTVQQSLPIAAVIAGILLVIAIVMGTTGKLKKEE